MFILWYTFSKRLCESQEKKGFVSTRGEKIKEMVQI